MFLFIIRHCAHFLHGELCAISFKDIKGTKWSIIVFCINSTYQSLANANHWNVSKDQFLWHLTKERCNMLFFLVEET